MKPSVLKYIATLLALTTAVSLVQAADVIQIPAFGTNNPPAVEPADAAPEEPTLKVGDPAPKLTTGKWMQGEPVKEFEKGTVYLIDFWATWCSDCLVVTPHLNSVSLKYKDKGLVVIGQDCAEEDQSKVAPFLKKMGDKMTYRIALDDTNDIANGKMEANWMRAAGRPGLPTAFVVDKTGTIAWIGDTQDLKDKLLDDVLAGTFDAKKAAAQLAERTKNQPQIEAINNEMHDALEATNWDVALLKLAALEKIVLPDESARLEVLHFVMLTGKKDYPAAYKLATQLSDDNLNNPGLQDKLAWGIATDRMTDKPDLDLAEKIANRGNEVAGGQNPSILDTLARIQFMRGKKDAAVAIEQKAMDVADDEQKKELQPTLDAYKKGELPKEDAP